MITKPADALGGKCQTKALIRELVRESILSMMTRLEAPFDARKSGIYIASLRQQQEAVGTALQARDWRRTCVRCRKLIGLPRKTLTDSALAWRVFVNTRDLLKVPSQRNTTAKTHCALGGPFSKKSGGSRTAPP